MTLEHKIKTNFIGKALSFFKRYWALAALGIGMSMFAYSCTGNDDCQYNTQCGHEAIICVNGNCVPDPNYNHNQDDVLPSEDIGYEKEILQDKEDIWSDPCSNPKNRFYMDSDGDGFGDENTWICEDATGFVKDNTDCDDNKPFVNKNAVEICDGYDNNCNFQIDENLTQKCNSVCGESIETCIDGEWKNCITNAQPIKMICSDNKLYKTTMCGDIGELVEQCAENEECQNSKCICVPDCYEKECGDDGCGESCGTCLPYYECIDSKFECVPIEGKSCIDKNLNEIGYCSKSMVCSKNCDSDATGPFCCQPEKPFYNHFGSVTYCCDDCYQYIEEADDFLNHCYFTFEML